MCSTAAAVALEASAGLARLVTRDSDAGESMLASIRQFTAPPDTPRSAAMSSSEVRQHQVGHAGIVAALAGAEIEHRLQQVFLALAGEARLGAFALIFALMAAGAADRRRWRAAPARSTSRGARGWREVGPGFFCEKYSASAIMSSRSSVCGDRRHHVVLAVAALVVAQLQIEIALVLAPDHRRGLLLRDAVLAVAAGAQRAFSSTRVGARRSPAHATSRIADDATRLSTSLHAEAVHDALAAHPRQKRRDRSGPVLATLRGGCVAARRLSRRVKAMMVLPRL